MKKKETITTPEKRVVKSYKVKPSVYGKAKSKADKKNTTVANAIEDFLYDYASR